ncbi:4561_t:CDS:1, partial [Acaulospora colombiana]
YAATRKYDNKELEALRGPGSYLTEIAMPVNVLLCFIIFFRKANVYSAYTTPLIDFWGLW